MSEPPENIEDVQARLRSDLSQFSEVKLANAILDFLKTLGNSLPSKELLASQLGKHLNGHAIFLNHRRFLEGLIQHRPLEFDAVITESWYEEMRVMMEWREKTGLKKPGRRKVKSEQERTRRVRDSKNRYEDRRRAARSFPTGLIEQQFSGGSGIPLLNRFLAPSGVCLDGLFSGGEVQMSTGLYSLESLFGLGRKLLPRSLPGRRVGREVFYDYRAMSMCMSSLLSDKRARWLADSERRLVVLRGVIARAENVASPDIAGAVKAMLSRFVQ